MARTRATAAKSAAAKPRAERSSRDSLGSKSSSSGDARSETRDDSQELSPRQTLVGRYELTGLSSSWDNDPLIRERIRENRNLCLNLGQDGEPASEHVDASTDTIKLNNIVLLPLCSLMRENELMLPCIDNLIQSVDEFFQITKRHKSMEHSYHEAWAIRRLLVKLKRFLYRDHPPQDSILACICLSCVLTSVLILMVRHWEKHCYKKQCTSEDFSALETSLNYINMFSH